MSTKTQRSETPQNYYTVKRGDTMVGIAQKFNTSVRVLKQLNNLRNPSFIFAGQQIKITEEE
jgi:LysM repeat protein